MMLSNSYLLPQSVPEAHEEVKAAMVQSNTRLPQVTGLIRVSLAKVLQGALLVGLDREVVLSVKDDPSISYLLANRMDLAHKAYDVDICSSLNHERTDSHREIPLSQFQNLAKSLIEDGERLQSELLPILNGCEASTLGYLLAAEQALSDPALLKIYVEYKRLIARRVNGVTGEFASVVRDQPAPETSLRQTLASHELSLSRSLTEAGIPENLTTIMLPRGY